MKSLNNLAKDLTYRFPGDPGFMSALMRTITSDEGWSDMMLLSTMTFHRRYGAQLRVAADVSRDLLAADVSNPDFGSLKWPALSMEVFFEDPSLPTFLVQLGSQAQRNNAFAEETFGNMAGEFESLLPEQGPDGRSGDAPYVLLHFQTKENRATECPFDIEEMNRLAAGDLGATIDHFEEIFPGQDSRNVVHTDAALASMLFKILLFANSVGHAPVELHEKPTRAQGGCPGFKGRPNTKRLKIRYLPEQLVERRKQAAESNATGSFNGRRGHWRTYKDSRFVNKQGRTEFIYPVPGPDGTFPAVRFVVRKPKVRA